MDTIDIESGGDLNRTRVTFTDICKNVRLTMGYQQIIFNVSGECNCQEMMAIMGCSGSGKTSLLQVLGGKFTDGVTGDVLLNGTSLSKSMRSHISYVWQDDIFYPSLALTVRDHLMFAAYVKMQPSTTHQVIVECVNSIMKQMQIEHRADTSLFWISGGERRRASIAKELLSDPRVLLLDEGTSGLDSAAAFDLLLKLKSLALEKNIPVINVIHQPSTRAFYLFDTVLMLSEGFCVYRGPPQQCMKFLSSAGIALPEHHCNPADFFLDLLASQEQDGQDGAYGMWPRQVLQHKWSERERESAGAKEALTEVDKSQQEASAELNELQRTPEYKSSYTRQVYAVLIRSAKAGFEVEFGRINVLQTLFMAVLAGLCWFQMPQTEDRVSDLAGYVLFVIAYWFFAGMFSGMLEFLPERVVLRRELSSGDYRLSAYFVAKTLASTPVRVLLPWAFVTISYFMVDAQPSAEVYFSLAALVVLATLAGNSIGACVGCLTEDYHVATSLTTVVSLSMLIVGGFYLAELPQWLSFLGNLSAFRYSYRACVQVVFGFRRSIACKGGLWIATCRSTPYGHIENSDIVAFVLGNDVDSLATNICVMILFCVSFRLCAFWALLCAERKTLFNEV